jgi:hypothetical protein
VSLERGFDADPLRSYLDSLRRIAETLVHIADLRWSGVVERRTRPDGVYEWYATGDGPLEVGELLTGG